MVRAALFLFLKDADDYLHEKPNADKKLLIEQKNAFDDLLRCGKMTKQMAELNQLDAHYISERFRGYVRRYYSEVQPEADTTRTDGRVSAR